LFYGDVVRRSFSDCDALRDRCHFEMAPPMGLWVEDEAAGQMVQDCLIVCQGGAADDEALRAHARQAAQRYEQRAAAWWRLAVSPSRR
jgi:hypothetical protein